jgi:FkbM family methyltransferase
VFVNRGSPREWNLYRSGLFEPHTLAAIRRHTPRGGCAVDIGANVGLITLALSAAVGSQGRVLALEPSPAVYARLLQNLALNPFAANVIARPVAASGSAGRVTFYAPAEPISGKGSLVRHDAGWQAIEVEALPLDALVAGLGWPFIDLIKCDVEGHDMAALRGARGLLEAHRPALLVEYEPELWAAAGHTFTDLLDLLDPLGCVLWRLPPLRWRALRRAAPVALAGRSAAEPGRAAGCRTPGTSASRNSSSALAAAARLSGVPRPHSLWPPNCPRCARCVFSISSSTAVMRSAGGPSGWTSSAW